MENRLQAGAEGESQIFFVCHSFVMGIDVIPSF